jgi:hypothetical protein
MASLDKKDECVGIDDSLDNVALYCVDSDGQVRKVLEPISGTAFSIQIEGL